MERQHWWVSVPVVAALVTARTLYDHFVTTKRRHKGQQADVTTIVEAMATSRLLNVVTEIRAIKQDLVALRNEVGEVLRCNTSQIPPPVAGSAGSDKQSVCSDEEFTHIDASAGVLEQCTAGLRACDLPYDRSIVEVQDTTSVIEALRLMNEHHTSCLIARSAQQPLARVVDMTDLTISLLNAHLSDINDQQLCVPRTGAIVQHTLRLSDVLKYLGERSYVCVEGDASEHPREYDVISHGAVLRHVHSQCCLDHLELPPMYPAAVVTTELSTPTRQAFRKMLLNSVRCLAVVDSEGFVVDALSLSDIRAISGQKNPEACLKMTCEQFLEQHAQPRKAEVVCCTKEADYARVISLMVQHDVHHVFVLSSDLRPAGIISSGQIFRALC